MSTIDTARHELIRKLLKRRPGSIPKTTAGLLQSLSVQLVTLICKRGFDSLYMRSRRLCSKQFPWLIPRPGSDQEDSLFLELEMTLHGQPIDTAAAASEALLATFLEILDTMIGEALASNILQAAWGNEVSLLVSAAIEDERG